MNVTKVSDITTGFLADYLRLADPSETDSQFLAAILKAVVSYMVKYTGLTPEQLDDSPEFVIAALALAQDMYDNRSVYADTDMENKTVSSILDMHRVNLLPSDGDSE